MDYRKLDDKLFALVDEHSSEVFIGGIKSAYPKSMQAMALFSAKCNSLKKAMFDAIDSDNPYAFRVLHRAFCEHYLKFTYIWVRMSKEKSDAVGKEYYSYCGAVELMEYGTALKTEEGLVGNDVAINYAEAVAAFFPDAAHLSKKELEAASGKFKYRAILRYLASDGIGLVSDRVPFLSAIVPAYALYSSFVHGGPYTDGDMFEYAGSEKLKECESDLEVVVMMNGSVFMMTAIAATFAKGEKVSAVAGEVSAILREFSTAHENS